MRPVLVCDLICAGRAVLKVDPDQRDAMARTLLERAETADRFCFARGVRHPEFGDGTLASAARCSGLMPEPTICDVEFSHALITVLQAMVSRPNPD